MGKMMISILRSLPKGFAIPNSMKKLFMTLALVSTLWSCVAVGQDGALKENPLSEYSYILGEGDQISIQVFDEPDLTMQARIGASGVINYSYLGDIQVKGKTPLELEKYLTTLFEDGYLVNPSVNVTITEFRSFYINGEVRKPGAYAYIPGLTLDRAIALAGGLTDRASTRKMFIQKDGNDSAKQVRAKMSSLVGPGDVISINEGFF